MNPASGVDGSRMTAATVAGLPIPVAEVDARERQLRAGHLASALPRPDTSEGRQLRRWLTQLLVAERVVGLHDAGTDVPTVDEVLPDTAARLEIGSIAAAVLATTAGRVAFARVTADVEITATEITDYHRRNPTRFGSVSAGAQGWRRPRVAVPLGKVRDQVAAHLLAAARRRVFRRWLDTQCAEIVHLAPGYEHPGDPRQPDNTHRH